MHSLEYLKHKNLSIALAGVKDIRVEGVLSDELRDYIRQHKDELLLSCFQQRARTAKDFNELHQCLQDFNGLSWTLLQRRDMSQSYTAHTLTLIKTEGLNEPLMLQDLSCLCWNEHSQELLA